MAVRAWPRPDEEPERIPTRQLLSGAVIAFLVGWLIWSLLWNGYLGGWWVLPLELFTPDSWRENNDRVGNAVLWYSYYTLIALVIMLGVGRLGRWGEVWRRFGPPAWRRAPPPPEPSRPPPSRTPRPGPRCAPPAPRRPPSGSPPRPGPG